jgi:antitoxin VapB
MGLSTVQEIERAIGKLTPLELEELYSWLDQNCPQPIDVRLESDLAAGRLDQAIHRALDDEKSGRAQPL